MLTRAFERFAPVRRVFSWLRYEKQGKKVARSRISFRSAFIILNPNASVNEPLS